MSESPNPYEATFLEDETPPEDIRFLRGRMKPGNVTGQMLQQIPWKVFCSNRGRFIGLGLLNILLMLLPMFLLMFVELFCGILGINVLAAITESWLWHIEATIFFLLGLIFVFWQCLCCVITAHWTLRLLRRETIFQRVTWKSVFRLIVAGVNCCCYALICWLMLLPAYFLLFSSAIALERTGEMYLSNIWLGVFVLGLIVFCLLALFVFGRYAIGLYEIIDRNVGCLTALRRAPRYSRGNTTTIALSFLGHCVLLGLCCVFTFYIGFLIVPGYLHCWMAVTYLLTTGQYDQPPQFKTTEW